MNNLDEKTINLLSQYHEGDNLETVKRQMNTILWFIAQNKMPYSYSLDFRNAVDGIMKEIIEGKFL